MIINTGWLLDYLSPKVPLPDLLTALPRVGLDVEATHVLARELAAVRVGFVRAKRSLEGTTDKFVVDVEVEPGDIRKIVCASAHPIEVGWGVPVALAETELPTGVTLHEEHFHGVLSQGMICLDGELGMTVARTSAGSGLCGGCSWRTASRARRSASASAGSSGPPASIPLAAARASSPR